MTDQVSPRDVIGRFYAAEDAYMNAGGADAGASFADMAATLDPDVVLHQSPDLPWGGTFHGHAGYEEWARQMGSWALLVKAHQPSAGKRRFGSQFYGGSQ